MHAQRTLDLSNNGNCPSFLKNEAASRTRVARDPEMATEFDNRFVLGLRDLMTWTPVSAVSDAQGSEVGAHRSPLTSQPWSGGRPSAILAVWLVGIRASSGENEGPFGLGPPPFASSLLRFTVAFIDASFACSLPWFLFGFVASWPLCFVAVLPRSSVASLPHCFHASLLVCPPNTMGNEMSNQTPLDGGKCPFPSRPAFSRFARIREDRKVSTVAPSLTFVS